MKRMRLWSQILLVLALFVSLTAPVMADEPGGGAVVGGAFVLEPGDTYRDDLVILGGSAHLQPESVVDGDVASLGGQLMVEGRVMGNVVSFGGAIRLSATARVDGDVIALGSLERDPAARVDGRVVEGWEAGQNGKWLAGLAEALPALGLERHAVEESVPAAPRTDVRPDIARAARRFGMAVTLLFVALVVMSLLPSHMQRITTFMGQSVVMSFAVGLLTLLISAFLVPLLIIICIGLPVALILVLGLLLGALVGWVAAGWFIAQKLRASLNIRQQTPMIEALAGTLLITAMAMVPCVGTLLAGVIVSWALGAAVLTRFGTATGADWLASGGAKMARGPAVANDLAETRTPHEAKPPRETRRLAGADQPGAGDVLPDEP